MNKFSDSAALPLMVGSRMAPAPGNWFDNLDGDPRHPVLPTPDCGYSVLAWANRFLFQYIEYLAHHQQCREANALAVVLEVFARLEDGADPLARRRESQAYETLADHYDLLCEQDADESLRQAFQLLLLLMMAVDQMRKTAPQSGLQVSYASVEEAFDARLRQV